MKRDSSTAQINEAQCNAEKSVIESIPLVYLQACDSVPVLTDTAIEEVMRVFKLTQSQLIQQCKTHNGLINQIMSLYDEQ